MKHLLAPVLLTCAIFGGSVVAATGADAQPEGAVAVCNWEDFEQFGHDGYNWRWWGCNLSLIGQHQCHGAPNTDQCYTVGEARHDVAAFRAWTGRG